MTSPALQLESVWFDEIRVVNNADYENESDDGAMRVGTEVGVYRHNEDESNFLVELTVTPADLNAGIPYDFSLKAMGIFTVEDSHLNEAPKLLHITGASMLYGSCREMLLTVTGRMGRRTVKLPVLSPRDAFMSQEPAQPTAEE